MKLSLKTVLTGSAATVALVAASSANASGYYIGLFGGIGTMEDSFDVSTSTGGGGSTSASTSTFLSFFSFGKSYATFSWDTLPNNTTAGTFTGLTGYGGTHYDYIRYDVSRYSRSTTLAVSGEGFADGFVVGAAIGWDFGTGWRGELEVAYRQNDLDDGTVSWAAARGYSWTDTARYHYLLFTYSATRLTYVGTHTLTSATTAVVDFNSTFIGDSTETWSDTGTGSTSGELETWSFMANVWYDFNLGDSPLHPFVGGGIGFATSTLDYQFSAVIPDGTYGFFPTTTASYLGNGEASDWGFAYQLGAGLGFELGNGMMLSAQYRYFNTGAMDLSLADQIEVNLESHNFLVGLNIPIGGN